MPEFRTPNGTRDILPPESARWEVLLARFARTVEAAGYGLVLSPMFEHAEVFQRVGESTDVVRKEMYRFTDRGGRELALRPEGTASIVRAFVQHRPSTPWKTWYAAPSFRYERAQAGRYRQHHQGGIEVLGTEDPDVDVEVIALAWEFFSALGLRQVALRLNSLGDAVCRPVYRDALVAFLAERADQLCDEHREHWKDNPLRVLDCKKPECLAATADAPHQLDYLCGPCTEHFARVREGLEALGITYAIDPRLVRGLDYYTRTTFEFAANALESAQNAVGGGGRYDGLVKEMGGPPTPGIGFGIGLDRTLLACDAEGILAAAEVAPILDVYVVDFAGGTAARDITALLRAAGFRADRAFDGRSPKSQFKSADRSGARLAVIVGPDEAAAGAVAIKDLRADADAGQERVDRAQLVEEVRRRLGG
ncbi:MAG TPA: histidine--tRNA ligase [Acidimicrobiales bacterium]|jgi:histidyl-tRNA synthetase|nr:histidine--tRNA ligase [Acidimicrobiales bacterium]